MSEIIDREESYRSRGACFEVDREQGCGFLEAGFQECLGLGFSSQAIPFQAHPLLNFAYKGRPLKQPYSPDLSCFGRRVVESKAVTRLTDEHRAQVHNYLRATGLHLGLLVNFGHFPKVEYARIVI